MTANGSGPSPGPSRDSSSSGDRHHSRSRPWRVEGMPEHHDEGENERKPPHWKEVVRRLWWPLLLLLVLNWIIVSIFVTGDTTPAATTVPYSFFHEQVVDHNVAEVTTTGDSISGTFEKKVRYPAGGESGTEVTRFETERPAFSNDRLVQQLLDNGVKVSAEAPSTGSSWTGIVLAFLPTLLIIGLLVWLFRRGMAAAGGGLGGFGRAPAPACTSRKRRDGRPSRTSPASTRSRRRSWRSSSSSAIRTASADSARRSPVACSSPVPPAPARPCWRGPSRERRTCRSCRCRRRSSSR